MKINSYLIQKRIKQKGKFTLPQLPFKFKKPKNLGVFLFRVFAVGILLIALLFLYYSKDLPNPNKLLERQVAESTKIFDREGQLLYEIHGEAKRTLVGLDQIPDFAEKATIAIEDKDFYNHHGLYFKGIARSLLRFVINFGPEGGGGSTLTQQFVKNAILNNQKTFDRKIREAILSLSIEAKFSKDEILKLYLNEIPYGRNAYGIEAASASYFNKKAENLTLAESAYLAALPQAPTFYNPLGPNRASLDARKNRVLKAMREQGYISAEEEATAKEAKVEFVKTKTAITAPHFVLWVQDYLAKKYGEKTLQEGGLKIYTTLDSKLQTIAEEAVKAGVANNEKKYKAYNAGLVAMDPKTGQILSLVGSKDYFGENFPENCTPKTCLFSPNVNVALSNLQPGSSFKPFVYVSAFGRDTKLAPATMLMDVKTTFGKVDGRDWSPNNYDNQERGPVSIRQSLAGSLNIPAVKTLSMVGVEKAVQTARDLGITSPMQDCGLALVLGGCEVKLIDHVAAYSVLANGGIKNEKTAILKILDRDGRTLEEFQSNPKSVLDPQAVYQLTSIMTDNNARSFVFGPNSPLTLPDRPVAAKTGTTQNWHDGWTMGFTPSLVAGVWAGNNCGGGNPDCLMKPGADGVLVAAPIWHKFMQEALADKPAEAFPEPAGIVRIQVDSVSGKLPTANTPTTKEEVFADYNQPTEYDPIHKSIPFDMFTNEPANANTPINQIIYKPFTIFHSELPNNPDWEMPVKTWALNHGYSYPPTGSESDTLTNNLWIKITNLKDNDKVETTPFTITLEAGGEAPIERIDTFIDGVFYKSLNLSPFGVEITKELSVGQHFITAKAIDSLNRSVETSIQINYGNTDLFELIEPGSNSLVIFPFTLKAKSGKKLTDVEFYAENTAGVKSLITNLVKTENFGNFYIYSFVWDTEPDEKTYNVFAKSGNLETKKITISIP